MNPASITLPRRAAAMALLLALAGCRVEHKSGQDDNNVKVVTPFGGLSVNTNQKSIVSDIGLSPYPGATLLQDQKDHDSAAVNLSFGSFHLGVHVAQFRTADAPDKVFAFYRKDLGRYGQVIQCAGGQAVGSPARTQDGLGCAEDKNSHPLSDQPGDARELKAGSHQHQHVVSVSQEGTGSRFALVSLELPGHLGDSTGD